MIGDTVSNSNTNSRVDVRKCSQRLSLVTHTRIHLIPKSVLIPIYLAQHTIIILGAVSYLVSSRHYTLLRIAGLPPERRFYQRLRWLDLSTNTSLLSIPGFRLPINSFLENSTPSSQTPKAPKDRRRRLDVVDEVDWDTMVN